MSFSHVIGFVALLSAGLAQAADPPAPPPPARAIPESATQPPLPPSIPPNSRLEETTNPAQTAAMATPTAKPGDATAGQTKSATCAACHGMDGNPASSQYPKLAGQHESYIARQVEMFKSHKRDSAIMMGFSATLSAQDMNDIGAFFATKVSLPGVADAKIVARGEALYRGGDKNANVPACMACHGPDGRGNPGAGYPQLAGQYADYVTLKLKDWHDGKTWGDDDRARIMPAVVMGLSDADIAALASYIEGLHAADAGSTAAK